MSKPSQTSSAAPEGDASTEIWQHFKLLSGGRVARCSHCQCTMKAKGAKGLRTWNMWNHVRTLHNEVYLTSDYHKRRSENAPEGSLAQHTSAPAISASNSVAHKPQKPTGLVTRRALLTRKLQKKRQTGITKKPQIFGRASMASQLLNEAFKHSTFPTAEMCKGLSKKLKIPVSQILALFRSRRYLAKKKATASASGSASQAAPAVSIQSGSGSSSQAVPAKRLPRLAAKNIVASAGKNAKKRLTGCIVKDKYTYFSPKQLSILEKAFRQNKYIGLEQRKALAKKLHASGAKILKWFGDRRRKETKSAAEESPAPDAEEIAVAEEDNNDAEVVQAANNAVSENAADSDDGAAEEAVSVDENESGGATAGVPTDTKQVQVPSSVDAHHHQEGSVATANSAFKLFNNGVIQNNVLEPPVAAVDAALLAKPGPILPAAHRTSDDDDDIVEITGRAFIKRLKDLHAKNSVAFLRAQKEISDAIFNFEMELAQGHA